MVPFSSTLTTVVVNAAGPWADQVLAGSDAERHEPLLGGTKGSHLVVEWPGGPKRGVFAAAAADGVSGQAVTPYVLAHLHRESGGRTEAANKALVAQNARLAGEVAGAL